MVQNLNKSLISYGESYYDNAATNMTHNSTSHPFTGQGVSFSSVYHAPENNDGGNDNKIFIDIIEIGSNNFTVQYYGRSTNSLSIDATTIRAAVRNSTNYVVNIGSQRTISDQMILGIGEATGNTSRISVEAATFNNFPKIATGSFANAITAIIRK